MTSDCFQKANLPSEDNLQQFRILIREATVLRGLPKSSLKSVLSEEASFG